MVGMSKHRKSGTIPKAFTGKKAGKRVRRKGLTRKQRKAKRGTHVNKQREPARRRVPRVATPKFGVGERVVVDFWGRRPVFGFTKKQCQRPGFVEMHKGRFMASDFAQIDYIVRLDEPFCQVEQWTVLERSLKRET